MDSLSALENWLHDQTNFDEQCNQSYFTETQDARDLKQESQDCGFGVAPPYDSVLEACLDDCLPLHHGPEMTDPCNRAAALMLDGSGDLVGNPPCWDAGVAFDSQVPEANAETARDEMTDRLIKAEAELQTMQGSLLTLRQELDNYNEWSYKLTFIMNEVQMRQHGLPPTLRQRGKLLPLPARPGECREIEGLTTRQGMGANAVGSHANTAS